MIRVTFKNGCIVNYRFFTYCDNIRVDNDGVILKNDIVKIEKQVKDLTIEEMNKLGCMAQGELIKDGIVKYGGLLYGIEHTLDDYIDITEIVKENE